MDAEDLALSRRAPRDLETSRRRSLRDRDAGLSRRGAALDRVRLAARNPHPRARRAASLRMRVEDGAKGALRALGAPVGHADRGARSVRGDAGAAEIPQKRPQPRRRPAPTWCAASRSPIRRRAFPSRAEIGAAFDWPACARARRASASACARRSATEFVDNALRVDAMREGVRPHRLGRPADLQQAQRARAVLSTSTAARCATS